MLTNAGLEFETAPADLDEEKIMAENIGKTPARIAEILAIAKACAVSKNHFDALVIGSDQVLEHNGKILSKAASTDDARKKLVSLRGQTHRLISAVCVAQAGKPLWLDTQRAMLTMQGFDDAMLDRYCAIAGNALTDNVGAYALEGAGVQLFDSVEGDYFTILGMPLLPLLKYLRQEHEIGL